MLRTLRVELRKLVAQRGTYVGFVMFAALIGLIVYGMWRYGPGDWRMDQLGGRDMLVSGDATTGPFVMQFILPAAMEVLLPLLIAAIGGGLIASEIRAGTLRTMLVRPITRLDLLTAKLGAVWAYTIALCGFVIVLGAVLCRLVFGAGDMISVMAHGVVIFSYQEALERLGFACVLAVLGRLVLAQIALTFSCLFDNGLTAAALTVAALMVFGVLEQIPYFESWRPYFLTWQLDIYHLPFEADIDWPLFWRRLGGLGVYSLGAYVVAVASLLRRDIS